MDVTKIYYNSHTLDVVDNINKITKAFPHVRTYQKAISDKYNIYTTTGSVIKGKEAGSIIKNIVSTIDSSIDSSVDTSVDIYRTPKIILLWATIRPDMFKNTHKYWIDMASNPENITTRVAVNSDVEADQLTEYNVLITNDNTPGVCFPCYCLSSTTRANSNDIVIFASDDFYPPKNWDVFLQNQLQNLNERVLMVCDGMQPNNSSVVTIPIMTYGALKKMNHIIYNPNYIHMWSDNELYDVAKRLNLIKDCRYTGVIFEHRHYGKGKRTQDIHDINVVNKADIDCTNYEIRKKLPVPQMLHIPEHITEKLKNIKPNKKELTIVTSISPKNISKQVSCINTWEKFNGKIYSLNSMSEIEVIKPNFPNVTFIETTRNGTEAYGKPYTYINDLLKFKPIASNELVSIINSDIFFEDAFFEKNIHESMLTQAVDFFVYANRFDKKDSKSLYKLGFDVFMFSGNFIQFIDKNELALGVPWWDYYLPMVSLLENYPLIQVISDHIVHEYHQTNYSTELHSRLCNDVIELINKKLPESNKISKDMNSTEFANNVLYTLWTKSKQVTHVKKSSYDISMPIKHGMLIGK